MGKTAMVIVAVNIAIVTIIAIMQNKNKVGNKKDGIVIKQSPTLTLLGFGVVFFSIVGHLTIILGNGEAGWPEVFVCFISTFLGAILSLRGTVRSIEVLPDGVVIKSIFGRKTKYPYEAVKLRPMFLAQVVSIKTPKCAYFVSAKSRGVTALIRNFQRNLTT